jgi:hypothetical protein
VVEAGKGYWATGRTLATVNEVRSRSALRSVFSSRSRELAIRYRGRTRTCGCSTQPLGAPKTSGARTRPDRPVSISEAGPSGHRGKIRLGSELAVPGGEIVELCGGVPVAGAVVMELATDMS